MRLSCSEKESEVQTHITCPSTGAGLAFEIQSDEDSIVAMWHRPVRIQCPLCQKIHVTRYRDAYVRGLMDQFKCLPFDVKEGRVH
jgi:hypothetical protein